MSRHVFNNSELSHEWAHRRVAYGRNSNGSFSFQGDRLYSYSTCIASIQPGDVILHTRGTWSVTTSQHQSRARTATSHMRRFMVDDASINHPNRDIDKNDLYLWFVNEVQEFHRIFDLHKKKVAKAKSRKAEYINYWRVEAENLHGLTIWADDYFDSLPHEPYFTPNQKTRLTRQFKKLVKESQSYRVDVSEATLQKIKEEQKRIDEKKEKIFLQGIKDWKEDKKTVVPYHPSLSFLRYNYELERVETSKGIQFSIEEASRLILAFTTGRLLGQEVKGYRITKVDSKARLIKAGCHTIPFTEVTYIQDILNNKKVISKNAT